MNVPPLWHESGDELHVTTGVNTDFRSRTFYGFLRNNGHFRHAPVSGDFTAQVGIVADYDALYDQAGLMI